MAEDCKDKLKRERLVQDLIESAGDEKYDHSKWMHENLQGYQDMHTKSKRSDWEEFLAPEQLNCLHTNKIKESEHVIAVTRVKGRKIKLWQPNKLKESRTRRL